MTEFNYLIYCPVCNTETNFLGGTAKAICMDCGGIISNPTLHERLTFFALEREKEEERKALAFNPEREKFKLIKKKIVELFELIKEA